MQVSRSMISLAISASLAEFGSVARYYRPEPVSVDPRQGCCGKPTIAVRNRHTGSIAGMTRWRSGFRQARLHCTIFVVRSEGLEPPRCYSLPPQGSASTNSATSAWEIGTELAPDRINGADVTNQGWRDKTRQHRGLAEYRIGTGLTGAGQPRQHSLDFNRNTVAIDKHYPA